MHHQRINRLAASIRPRFIQALDQLLKSALFIGIPLPAKDPRQGRSASMA